MTLPRHLRFLEDLSGRPHDGLAAYFPETAAGMEQHRGEYVFWAGELGYLGNTDGTMVPVDAEGLAAMPENIWDERKFSALVDAAESGAQPVVYPGYADLFLEDGALTAQVRDGNHRTFAAVVAGAPFSWVLMSDRTKQELGEDGYDRALYRAIRKAQREQGAPMFKRKSASRLKGGAHAELLAGERRYDEITQAMTDYYSTMLRKHGRAEGTGYSLEEQLQRPQMFWRTRARELSERHDIDWHDDPLVRQGAALERERQELWQWLWDARKAAGLDPRTERLDPASGKVVRN